MCPFQDYFSRNFGKGCHHTSGQDVCEFCAKQTHTRGGSCQGKSWNNIQAMEIQNPESSLDFHIPLNTQQTPRDWDGPWETQPGHTKQRNGDGRLKEWVTNYLKQELLKKQLVWGKEGHDKTSMGPDKTPRKAPWSHFCPQNSPWPRSFPTQMQDKLDLTPIILCSFPPHCHGHDITPPKKQPRISPGWDKLNIYNPRVTSAAPHPVHTTKDFFQLCFFCH